MKTETDIFIERRKVDRKRYRRRNETENDTGK